MEQPVNKVELTPEELAEAMAEVNVAIANGEALARLMKNKDFKTIVMKSYLENGAEFLVKNMTRVREELEGNVINQLKARSFLHKHFADIEEKYASAKAALEELEG